MSLVSAVGAFLSMSWRIFMDVEVPGLGVSFGFFWIAVLLAGFSIRILSVMLGTHVFSLDSLKLPRSGDRISLRFRGRS